MENKKCFWDRLHGKDLGFWCLVMVILGALIAFGVISYQTGRNLDNVSLIVGTLITNLGLLLNYRYGSSKGSKDKQDLLDRKPPSPPLP